MIYFQSHVDRILAAKDSEIKTLREELMRARDQAENDRMRADNAVDQVLSKSYGRPLTPPPQRRSSVDSVRVAIDEISSAGREFGEEPQGAKK